MNPQTETIELIKNLINSGQEDSIYLAFQLVKGAKIDPQIFLEGWELLRVLGGNFQGKPEKILSQIFKLKRLSIFSNKHKLPQKIQYLSSLERLHLKNYNDEQLDPIIFKLQGLKELIIRQGNLMQIGEGIGQLHNLQTIDFRYNLLEQLPKDLGYLSKLTHLNLSYNCLNKLPNSIHLLSNLKELWLAGNALEYLPDSIVQLKNLKFIDLQKNPMPHWRVQEYRDAMPHCSIINYNT